MVFYGSDVVAYAEAVRLAVLRGDVADVYLGSRRGDEAPANTLDEEVGQDAGVEAPGAEDYEVGVEDSADGFGVRGRVLGSR
jgi:hypothetical protein